MKTAWWLPVAASLALFACSGGGSSSKPADPAAGGDPAADGGGVTGLGDGGAAENASVITVQELGFSSPRVAVSSDGTVRVVYTAGAAPQRLYYAECKDDCGAEAGWTHMPLDEAGFITYPRIAVGADGTTHLVYERSENGDRTFYARCAGACTQTASWKAVDLTETVGNTRTAYRSAPIAVGSDGRVSFLTQDLSVNGRVVVASCKTGCEQAASWSAGIVRNGGNRFAMAAHGTTLHQIFNDEANALRYRRCDANCTVAESWKESQPLFPHDGNPPTAIAVTDSGVVHVAYNQGAPASGDPNAAPTNTRLIVQRCDGDCLAPSAWSGVALGEPRDGEEGLSLLSAGEAVVVASTSTLNVTTYVCAGDCANDQSWGSAVIDDSQTIAGEFDPYVAAATGCTSGTRPQFAAWYPKDGVVAVTPAGSAVFVHASYLLRQCPGATSSTRLPGFGRIVYVP